MLQDDFSCVLFVLKKFINNMLLESFCIVFEKYKLGLGFRLSLVLNLFLISIKFQARVVV